MSSPSGTPKMLRDSSTDFCEKVVSLFDKNSPITLKVNTFFSSVIIMGYRQSVMNSRMSFLTWPLSYTMNLLKSSKQRLCR